MGIFNEDEIIKIADDTISLDWCNRYINGFEKMQYYYKVSVDTFNNTKYFSKNVGITVKEGKSRYFLPFVSYAMYFKNGQLHITDSSGVIPECLVIMNWDGQYIPEFINIDVSSKIKTPIRVVAVNCPNLKPVRGKYVISNKFIDDKTKTYS